MTSKQQIVPILDKKKKFKYVREIYRNSQFKQTIRIYEGLWYVADLFVDRHSDWNCLVQLDAIWSNLLRVVPNPTLL